MVGDESSEGEISIAFTENNSFEGQIARVEGVRVNINDFGLARQRVGCGTDLAELIPQSDLFFSELGRDGCASRQQNDSREEEESFAIHRVLTIQTAE